MQLLFCRMLLPGFVKTCSTSHFFSIHFIKVQLVQPYNNSDMATFWKNLCYILSERSDFHLGNKLMIVVHAFLTYTLILLLVDKISLPRCVKSSTNFTGMPFNVEMIPSSWKHMNFVLSEFMHRPIILNSRSRWYCGVLDFEGQGLRARLCCRKISDSIFWLYYFPPR